MPTALVIGRFQPPHYGHLKAITALLKKHYKVLIGIGSSQESCTRDNPLNYEERKEMLQECLPLSEESIFPIPDFPSDDEWVEYIFKRALPFDEVHTNNPIVAALFTKRGRMVYPLPVIQGISGTKIRSLLKAGKPISGLVPPSLQKRIRSLRHLFKSQ